MSPDDTQPEDIEGTAVDRVPQRRGDRRTHFTLVALALLSALFFAGALAYAVGGGLLSGEEAPGDPSRAELPRQWSNLQPLEPIGPDSGGTGGSGGERGGATIAPGRLVGPAGGPAFASTEAGIPPVASVARPVAASPLATVPRLTRRLPVIARVVDTGRRVRLPSLDRVGVALPDLPRGDAVDIPDIDPFPDGLELPPVDPFPDGLELPPIVPFPNGLQIPRVDPFPGGFGSPPVQPLRGGVDPTPVGQPSIGGLLSVGGDPSPLSELSLPGVDLLGTGLRAARERDATPLAPPLVPLTDIDGGPPPTRRETSSAAGAERRAGRDEPRRRPRVGRPRNEKETESEGALIEDRNGSAHVPEADERGRGAHGRGRTDEATAERAHREHGAASGGSDSENCARDRTHDPQERRGPLEPSDDRFCEDATRQGETDQEAVEEEDHAATAGTGDGGEAAERVGASLRESGT